ncbi:MAG: hypothetical protein P1U82_07420 [Verrucomicrobiales bacterium]|jgi:hypothetical protein|nr:hypothetical protein [Verrucomicrobiales bacterium]
MTRYLREHTLRGPLIDSVPASGLRTVVVIPAKDEENLIESLEALVHCNQTHFPAEVIVVVNTSERDGEDCHKHNKEIAGQAKDWAATHSNSHLRFHILTQFHLPKKHAGVGLARKIGMDEACLRLEAVGSPTGVIVCFDGDSLCDRNYLTEIEKHFDEHPKMQGASIYFEHPLEGEQFSSELYEAIIGYELHLRVFVQAQRWAGFPFATQTIGSSMAVRSDAYQEQCGMNKRQAGEDFYFLHKFTPLGRVREINTTRVIPSPRPSHRVPFGTGKAVEKLLESNTGQTTYAPQSFQDLKGFFDQISAFYHSQTYRLPESVSSFLATRSFEERIAEIRSHVTSYAGFETRFFRYFNAFLIMKYLHHARDHFYPDADVTKAARWLLHNEGESIAKASPLELLLQYREADRSY